MSKYFFQQQINGLEIRPDGQMVAACGYQHIRMYDLASTNPDPVITYEGVSKNVSRVGFSVSVMSRTIHICHFYLSF